MKTKFLYIAALALTLCFVACESQAPFDTQDPNDAPLILKPYNESGTGSFTYYLANPETPLVDSVTVTPSRYTTVYWYVDGELVHTGTKIEHCFAGGVHNLVIEAVTEAGKSTKRTGTIIVFGGEKQLWAGPANLDWNAQTIRVTKEQMAAVPQGATIRIYFTQLEEQDYYALRIIPGDSWGDEASEADNVLVKMDMKNQPTPLTFEWNALRKSLVDSKGSMSLVGNGVQIILIDYE